MLVEPILYMLVALLQCYKNVNFGFENTEPVHGSLLARRVGLPDRVGLFEDIVLEVGFGQSGELAPLGQLAAADGLDEPVQRNWKSEWGRMRGVT